MFLKKLSSDILKELDIGPSELNALIKNFAKNSGSTKTKEFNLKRSFKKMSDSSFAILMNGVLPIEEYELTLSVKKDNHVYKTSIRETIVPPTDYIRLGNVTCLKVYDDDGIKLVDVKTDEYKDYIGAYDGKD